MSKDLDALKYPIGKFKLSKAININVCISVIEKFPELLKKEVLELTEANLDTLYRPKGWSIRQVIHHCADSHLNSFIRFKLALTENTPTIKPYLEELWAELPDSKNYPIQDSLTILEGLHKRWSVLLKSLSKENLEQKFRHPETNALIDLKTNIAIYAWHCKHHLAHINQAKQNI